MEARLHEAEDEMARLRGDVRQLRTEASIEKKQKEDLQLRLVAQKEELKEESLLQTGRRLKRTTKNKWMTCSSSAIADV